MSSDHRQPEHLMEPTDDLSAVERRELIASMRPSDAEGVPELHEVDIPADLREQIETSMSHYPQLRSASIPALWAVQRHYGWCSPDGIRQAAAVMGVTPAYLQSVASFYDLFATSPVGTHRVLVCHNISCWMRGADSLLDRLLRGDRGRSARGRPPRRDLARRRVLRQGLRVPRRLRHRADGLDRRALLRPARPTSDAMAAIEAVRAGSEPLPDKALAKRGAGGRPRTRNGSPGGVRGRETRDERRATGRCLKHASSSTTSTPTASTRSRATGATAATRALQRAFRDLDPDELLETFEDVRSARPRRRRLLDGQEGLVPAPRRDGEVPLL